MIDFTKSELSIMHLAILRDINKFDHILKTSPSMTALREKLETMIDNYEQEYISVRGQKRDLSEFIKDE